MNKAAKIAIGLAILALALVGLRFGLSMNQPDDQQLISEALHESLEASKEGKPGSVLDLLSDRFQLNQNQTSRADVAKAIRDFKPSVTIVNDRAAVTGDQARITSPVDLEVAVFGKRTLNDVTLVFKKEDTMKYLFIPTKSWKLTSVEVPQEAIQDFVQMGL